MSLSHFLDVGEMLFQEGMSHWNETILRGRFEIAASGKIWFYDFSHKLSIGLFVKHLQEILSEEKLYVKYLSTLSSKG